MVLADRKILVTGVATRQSIAFAVAREAQLAGAEVLLTSFGRMASLTRRAAKELPEPTDVLQLDVTSAADFAALATELETRWGRVDGALHAVAYAPPDALGGDFLTTPAASAGAAFETSAYSFKALAEALRPLAPASGASFVGLDFDASVAWPAYDWMGVSKAALEAVSRYLARDLGSAGIRVNLIAAGPLRTLALSGIPGASALADAWDERAPLGWDTGDPTPVARTACFLLSDWASAITGEIVHVDGGFHAVAFPQIEAPAEAEAAAPRVAEAVSSP